MISYEEFADIAEKQLMTPTLNLYHYIIQRCKEMLKHQWLHSESYQTIQEIRSQQRNNHETQIKP